MPDKRIKDRIDGEEIDYSLSELSEVPEKDLALYPKATHVDLSRNHLTMLSPTFADLKHIVKLDLSKNNLRELPTNFGHLHKLQYLDLYGNKLVMLPVSFCQLKALKWLDLKDNCLDKQLATAAGDCLDEKQCQSCAKNVVIFMQSIQSQLEKERQKMLKREQAMQQKLQAAEEEEKLRLKKEKKLAKERRKAENLARKKELEKKSQEMVVEEDNSGEPNVTEAIKDDVYLKKNPSFVKSRSCLCSFLLTIFKLLLLLVIVCFGFVFYDHINSKEPLTYDRLHDRFFKYYVLAKGNALNSINMITKWVGENVDQFYKANIKK